jgi:hypothetical protein
MPLFAQPGIDLLDAHDRIGFRIFNVRVLGYSFGDGSDFVLAPWRPLND